MMKIAAICLVSCVLFSMLPAHFSHEEPNAAPTDEPRYCLAKYEFGGSCTDRGSPSTTCYQNFVDEAFESPKNCICTPKPKHNKYLCQCYVVCQ
ncbi:Defensin-like protein [Cardamine amara subsp. amara]|uniref:Defensin-like protein n=1 Tax=Cardamine amara subsp. amara TaxID=228776 RepID=A0ABD1BQT3_CARAN